MDMLTRMCMHILAATKHHIQRKRKRDVEKGNVTTFQNALRALQAGTHDQASQSSKWRVSRDPKCTARTARLLIAGHVVLTVSHPSTLQVVIHC